MMFSFAIQEITSVDDIPYDKSTPDFERCMLPLFHGTRRHAIECPQEELDKMIRNCKKVVQYCYNNWNYFCDNEEITRKYRREHENELHSEYFGSAVLSQYESPHYQYNDFYVTNNFAMAVKYFTAYGCGEISALAYGNAKGIRDLGWPVSDKEVDEAIEYVLKYYPDYYNSEKVVLAVYDFAYQNLYWQGGDQFVPDKGIIEMIYDFEVSDCGTIGSYSFRVNEGANEIRAKLIPEKLFEDGFGRFTDIKDMQTYLNKLY